ncbi:MAG: DUF4082 domain-containing protein [Ruminiclostridium sp.]
MNLCAVVVVNSKSEYYTDFEKYLLPYLNVFGVPFKIIDRAIQKVDGFIMDHQVVILAHKNIGAKGALSWTQEEKALLHEALVKGIGIVSYDIYADLFNNIYYLGERVVDESTLTFSQHSHYITSAHELGECIELDTPVTLGAVISVHEVTVSLDTRVILSAGELPYVFIKEVALGRFVQWVGYQWMDNSIRGPLWGLDDLIWKSIVWAARKPFILRDIPNFATLRVDDCVGDHGYYKDKPFEWVEIANKYGFKPWLGFFYDRISLNSTNKMKELVSQKKGTAQFHGMNLLGLVYSTESPTTEKIRNKVKAWMEKTGWDLPFSIYLIPHAYDLAEEALPVFEELGVQIVGIPYEINSGGGAKSRTTKWLKAGPYRLFSEGIDGTPWDGEVIHQPIYYADFYKSKNDELLFFNILSEVRDVRGYEWFNYAADDSQFTDVEGAIWRGTEIFKRCFDSKVLANLFTHDDSWRGKFISKIPPDKWESMIAGVVSNISSYDPKFTTVDEAVAYVRDLNTSKLKDIQYQPEMNLLHFTFSGYTEAPTGVTVFKEKNGVIITQNTEVNSFKDGAEFEVRLNHFEIPAVDTIYKNNFPIETCKFDHAVLLGTKFYTAVRGAIEKVRLFVAEGEQGLHQIQLWDVESEMGLIEPVYWLIDPGEAGWREYILPYPIEIFPVREYIVSISTRIETGEPYICSVLPGGACFPAFRTYLGVSRGNGVYSDSLNKMPTVTHSYYCYFRDIVFKPY